MAGSFNIAGDMEIDVVIRALGGSFVLDINLGAAAAIRRGVAASTDTEKRVGGRGRVVLLVVAEFIAHGRITTGSCPDEINFDGVVGFTGRTAGGCAGGERDIKDAVRIGLQGHADADGRRVVMEF